MSKEVVPVKKDETLFVLVQLSHQIQQALVESMGELTPDVERAIDKLHEKLPQKADAYKYFMDDLKAQAQVWNDKALVFTRISKAFISYIDRMKYSLKMACLDLGVEEIEGKEYRWKIVNNAASLVVEDENLIPSKYKEVVTSYKIRSDLIKKALKSGEIVPGARLETGSHVRSFPLTKAK